LALTLRSPGNNGNIKATQGKNSQKSVLGRALNMIMKRATNVNEDYVRYRFLRTFTTCTHANSCLQQPMAFSVPAGTTCTGTMAGQSNVCLVKIANSNKAGPFGGVIAIQMAGGAAGNTTAKRTAQEFSA
jgi:hypothetical protein